MMKQEYHQFLPFLTTVSLTQYFIKYEELRFSILSLISLNLITSLAKEVAIHSKYSCDTCTCGEHKCYSYVMCIAHVYKL